MRVHRHTIHDLLVKADPGNRDARVVSERCQKPVVKTAASAHSAARSVERNPRHQHDIELFGGQRKKIGTRLHNAVTTDLAI